MKRIIILERLDGPRTAFRVALRAEVPVERQAIYANPDSVSVYRNTTSAELQDIRDGKVVEVVETISVEDGRTENDVKGFLQERWQNFQNSITNQKTFVRYGTSWDGTAWTAAGF